MGCRDSVGKDFPTLFGKTYVDILGKIVSVILKGYLHLRGSLCRCRFESKKRKLQFSRFVDLGRVLSVLVCDIQVLVVGRDNHPGQRVTVDVPYGTGDSYVLRLDLLDGCPKQEKRRCRKYILIHHIRCKFNVLNIQPLPTRILPILTGDGPHIIDLGKRNWHLEPFVGVALTLF